MNIAKIGAAVRTRVFGIVYSLGAANAGQPHGSWKRSYMANKKLPSYSSPSLSPGLPRLSRDSSYEQNAEFL